MHGIYIIQKPDIVHEVYIVPMQEYKNPQQKSLNNRDLSLPCDYEIDLFSCVEIILTRKNQRVLRTVTWNFCGYLPLVRVIGSNLHGFLHQNSNGIYSGNR